ncbi:hypothetical protein [Roseibium aggregatum]|uniref:hypothetical protein n=1 Tax=Roseibium aggregatum TaxID=187304 RepID=UPI003A9766DD
MNQMPKLRHRILERFGLRNGPVVRQNQASRWLKERLCANNNEISIKVLDEEAKKLLASAEKKPIDVKTVVERALEVRLSAETQQVNKRNTAL